MKKLIAFTLSLVLALSLSACTVNSGGKSSGSNNSPSANPANSPSGNPANSNAGNIPIIGMNSHWPADLVPELPEYTYGNITGYAPDEYGNVTIKAGETGQADLDEYLDSLEAAGWAVTKEENAGYTEYATALKGSYRVTFQLQADTYVQFDVKIAQAGEWPSFDQFPMKLTKPEGYALADVWCWFDADITEEQAGEFTFTCLDMDIDAALEYYYALQDNGCFEPFEYQGKTYVCWTIEDQIQTEGDNALFYFEIWVME